MMFEYQTRFDLLTLVEFDTRNSMVLPREYALEFRDSGLSIEEFSEMLDKRTKNEKREPQN
jgi:hypothetical protein